MATTPTPSTKERILDAARTVFMAKGFQGATTREICGLAKVNLASMHYHFQDKENLYLSIIESFMAATALGFPLDEGVTPDSPPEDKLRAFVRAFLCRALVGDGAPNNERMVKLVAAEFSSPKTNLERLVQGYARPLMAVLYQILAELLSPGIDGQTTYLCAMSVIGQCMHYVNYRPQEVGLFKDPGRLREDVERVANHITAFSLAGMRAIYDSVGRPAERVSPVDDLTNPKEEIS